MAAVTFRSDFGAQEEEICHYFHLFPFYLSCSNGAGCHDLSFFLIFTLMVALSLSSFTLIKRLFSSSLLSVIRVMSSAYLRLLMFLPPVLIPACNSSSWHFSICSAYRLNKQVTADSLILLLSLEPISCSVQHSNCCFLTHIQVSHETGKMVWVFLLLVPHYFYFTCSWNS